MSICLVFRGILEPENVGEDAKKPDGLFAQRATSFGQNWCHFSPQPSSHHRHLTCMTEQRHINHLTAVVMSQSYSEASARDTHQLWLKGWNQHVKRPNVRGTGREQEERRCVCVCVFGNVCAARERLRVESKEWERNQELRQSIWDYLSTEGIL